MNNNFWLLIDDLRTFDVDLICRNPQDGLKALREHPVTHLVLDNDLAAKLEGHEVLKIALAEHICPNNVILVTSNPVARERMQNMLKSASFKTIDGVRFHKYN